MSSAAVDAVAVSLLCGTPQNFSAATHTSGQPRAAHLGLFFGQIYPKNTAQLKW